MYAGLDFGTSNCLIGVMEHGQPVLIPLEDGKPRLPSCLYIDKDCFAPATISNAQLSSTMKAIQSQPATELSHEALINLARQQLRKAHRISAPATKRAQSIVEALKSSSDILVGEHAAQMHIHDPENGFYIKSPKSFLGADINSAQRGVFTAIVEKMLAFIKEEAEAVKEIELTQLVIGRPVNFHGLLGHDGNQQALSIIDTAAKNIGLKHIEFLMEPVAAAYDYERQLSQDRLVLILDLGGGTTDCSMIKIGPSYRKLMDRQHCILSHTGQRIGGIDLDNKLALMTLMPHFGKNIVLNNGLPVPNHLFKQAVTLNDVSAQQDFNSSRTTKEIERYLTMTKDHRLKRLKTLRDEKYGLRVSRSAEQAKILLSEQQHIELPLPYIEANFDITISRQELGDAIADELRKFETLMTDAITQAGTQPDAIYVTGGTALSPTVQQWINSAFPDSEIVIGDHFGSVTSGLVTQAQRLFG
ncbi:molecular chaperone [Flavobacterium sp. W21_SRS_FM6]|uniref:molecular chaperone n=1 Tax=Flavobacterium sp. W21_SRS_FM6 TaxID=3240268 RepID=UPI003F908A03